MILVMTGMEKYPFDRLIKIIDKNVINGSINDNVVAIIGNSSYKPFCIECRKFLDYSELLQYINKANIIITHAGSGSVLLCLNNSKIPIVFPRHRELGEHIDNHQVEFSEILKREERTLVAYNEEELIYNLDHYFELIKKIKKQSKIISNIDNLINYLEAITIDK